MIFHRHYIYLLLSPILFLCIEVYFAQNAAAQTDKKAADELLFNELISEHLVENYHDSLSIDPDRIISTGEPNVFIVPGDTFQISSLSNKFYIYSSDRMHFETIFDRKHPVESLTNLLLNKINDNPLDLQLTHHIYGETHDVGTIKMQTLYDLFSRNMNIYCSINSIDTSEIKASLVFHHPTADFIHLFLIDAPLNTLFDPNGTIKADLYSNIPQKNLKSIR